MTEELDTVLILLVLLQTKHMFADFFLQTARMLSDRAAYIHVGRIQHAGLHGAFSAVSLFLVGSSVSLILVVCLAEFLVHYHIDWAKGRYSEQAEHGPGDAGFWRAFGVDQLAHQLTYVAMIWTWGTFHLVT